MGRPLNKRYFGTPTDGGNEIKVQFHNGTGSVNGWIVKQLGSKKFRCTDGTATEDCFLVDKAAGALTAGDMTITVSDDAGNPKQVTKIAGRKVTLDTGESIAWNFSDSTSDGAVEMEEAGSETIINAEDGVNGVVYEIVTAGDTDFTTIGAADSNVGTVFTAATIANAAGTTGTMKIAPDDFEGDE
jgi:hypothetical protein